MGPHGPERLVLPREDDVALRARLTYEVGRDSRIWFLRIDKSLFFSH